MLEMHFRVLCRLGVWMGLKMKFEIKNCPNQILVFS